MSNNKSRANRMSLPGDFVNTVEGYVDLNMLEEAAEECLRMVDRFPDHGELLAYSAGKISLGSSDQIKRLLRPIERYLRTHPNDLRVRECLAVLLSLEKRYAESLHEFAKVPPKRRQHDANWVWFKTPIDSGANEEVRQWIANIWPAYSVRIRKEAFREYLKFLWDVSAFLLKDGQYEEAEAGYRFLLDNDPGAIGAYLDYGKLLMYVGRKEGAIAVFRRGLSLSSREVDEQSSYPGGIIGCFRHERCAIENEIKDKLRQLETTMNA